MSTLLISILSIVGGALSIVGYRFYRDLQGRAKNEQEVKGLEKALKRKKIEAEHLALPPSTSYADIAKRNSELRKKL